MPLLILSILIQAIFVIHIVKTGRSTTWIWIVIMLPMAGVIAYLFLEVLPDMSNTRAGRQAGRKVQSVINPNKDINSAAKQFSLSGTIENSRRLAEECYNKGLYSEAKKLYERCLTGVYFDDPGMLFGLAKSEFELENYQESKSLLERLIELNPDYKNQDAHLLYARALENVDSIAKALHEYETLHNYFAGPEASYYYAKFLQYQKLDDKAHEVFNQIITKANNLGKHYNLMHGVILKRVKKEISS